jgi:hypothetical protein
MMDKLPGCNSFSSHCVKRKRQLIQARCFVNFISSELIVCVRASCTCKALRVSCDGDFYKSEIGFEVNDFGGKCELNL